MTKDVKSIINFLLDQRGVDFSGYTHSLVEQQLNQRLTQTGIDTIPEYLDYLQSHKEEIDHLIDSLIINVTSFFRNPLLFNYLTDKVLPKILLEKEASPSPLLRIWSAGCASGEEPYSIAMEINKLLKNAATNLTVNIFATDIDTASIRNALFAEYSIEKMDTIRFEFLKYFTRKEDSFTLEDEIKTLVNFSTYDLLDKHTYSPPESLYGGFDIVMCRNVLIYYNKHYQNKILTKLYRSLNIGGYLVLGETETPTRRFHGNFKRVNECCRIFKKL